MKITTINTIEVSSMCDNSCVYCPAPKQHEHRKTGFITRHDFEKAIALVQELCRRGTQRELNLFGVGEPTLHPDIVALVKHARQSLPKGQHIHLNTNGNRMTPGLAEMLRDAGISQIDVTVHENHEAAARTIRIFRILGIEHNVSIDPVVYPNNWAGQVDWFEPDKRFYNPGPCPWLNRGQAMVMSDGNITTCCIDAFAKNVFSNVSDADVWEKDVKISALCKTCHHSVN